MSVLKRIAVVSRNAHIHNLAQEVADEVFVADDLAEARDIVQTVAPDLTVFDGTVPPSDIRDFQDAVASRAAQPPVTVVAVLERTAFSDRDYRTAGVLHLLQGEEECRRLHEIATQIREGAQRQAGDTETRQDYFVDEHAALVGMVGASKATQKTLEMIKLIAASQCNPVLILGETGTGKEIAARAVHDLRHPDEPFVAINCAALTATLLESELFGHVKGSFTGADRDKTGLLELAGSGTLFLDEISETPLELQAKLLRVLQERTFRKVGGARDLTCKATIVASSNRNLKKEVTEKRFRQDLYYRLNICPVVLAPLRSPDRREDIRLLAEYFLKNSDICGAQPNKVTAITKFAMEALHRHDWPGNVRELRNVLERAILLETTEKIGLSSIMIESDESEGDSTALFNDGIRDFSLEKAERELIARALHQTGWQKTQAASLLGITRATLYAKVKQYNIQKQTPQTGDITFGAAPPAQPEPVTVA
ncbi:MAG: sigma-54 interaction domain-containing protein [Planctomycetota bacterium]|jgi:transcriptional regulator with PAS, ATPase and Fis domain